MRSSLRTTEGEEPYASGCLINRRQNTFRSGRRREGMETGGRSQSKHAVQKTGKHETYFITVVLCNYRKKEKKNHHRKFVSLFTTL